MKGQILREGIKNHTCLKKIFDRIGNYQINYNWLITDITCYPSETRTIDIFEKDYVWISGKDITDIINKEDIQFIWAVFSGFRKDIDISEILEYSLPYVDENEEIWNEDVSIQHPMAEIEIVAYDSSCTILISKKDELINNFKNTFLLSEELSLYNLRNK